MWVYQIVSKQCLGKSTNLYIYLCVAVEENTTRLWFLLVVLCMQMTTVVVVVHAERTEPWVVMLLSCHICCVWWPVMWLHSTFDYKITSNWKESPWNTMSRLQNKWSVHCALGHITNISERLLLEWISVDSRAFIVL